MPLLSMAESKQKILDGYRSRYQNFFERQRQEDQRERQRLSGRGEVREKREMKKELLERARKKYVVAKPPPKDQTKAYQRHLEQLEKEKRTYLKKQERYSKMQREVEKVTERALKIPPVLEFELQNQL